MYEKGCKVSGLLFKFHIQYKDMRVLSYIQRRVYRDGLSLPLSIFFFSGERKSLYIFFAPTTIKLLKVSPTPTSNQLRSNHYVKIIPEPQRHSYIVVSIPNSLNYFLLMSIAKLTSKSHVPTSIISKNIAAVIKQKYPVQSTHNFNVEVTESRPTTDQLSIIRSSKGVPAEFKEETSSGVLGKVPILVDWDNGKVAIDNEAQALKILSDKDNESN